LKIYWNAKGNSVIVASESSFFLLDFDSKLVEETIATGKIPEDGIDDCINLVKEIPEIVVDGQWIGDCFVYTNAQNKLNYYIGGEIVTLSHLDSSCFYLGCVSKNNRVYLLSNNQSVISYELHLSVLQYETAIVNGDLESAEKILPSVPVERYNELARFLDHQGQKKIALSLTKDLDHKFDLSLELGDMKEAYLILKELDSDTKWRQLGGIALSQCDFKLAEECLLAGKDYNGLLLLYSSLGDLEGFKKLSQLTLHDGKNNLAFLTHFLIGDLNTCLSILIDTKRFPEATFFCRTYLPKETSKVLTLWKKNLSKKNASAAERLADPVEFSNLFPDFSLTDQIEEFLSKEKEEIPSIEYLKYSSKVSRNMIEIMKGDEVVENKQKNE
jgi:coatomer subunit beta'